MGNKLYMFYLTKNSNWSAKSIARCWWSYEVTKAKEETGGSSNLIVSSFDLQNVFE